MCWLGFFWVRPGMVWLDPVEGPLLAFWEPSTVAGLVCVPLHSMWGSWPGVLSVHYIDHSASFINISPLYSDPCSLSLRAGRWEGHYEVLCSGHDTALAIIMTVFTCIFQQRPFPDLSNLPKLKFHPHLMMTVCFCPSCHSWKPSFFLLFAWIWQL